MKGIMMKVLRNAAICLLFIGLQIQKSDAQTSIAQAQAVFIYNFTRLIEWPEDYKAGDFIIGVYGPNDIFSEIKNFTTGKMVGSQPISVVKYSDAASIKKSHILFVAFGKTKEMSSVIGALGGTKTLIITEKKGALDEGSAINFVIVDDRLKFELKMNNATKLGLKVHSNLENMAIAKY
jgi:hypothetical protein